ncbi:MAG: metalloregulator ArsR/SmtB family transcription factor [Acidobacteria bacterium]|nr:metalloregulator ArsR/SmtB family transcription factor [Acidobacteriota bacterium]
MANYTVSLDSVFRALSDPTRRAVVQRLVAEPTSVKTLAEPFDMALPSFMKHLAVLEDCGLIASTKSGRVRTCRLQPRRLAVVDDWVQAQLRDWEGVMQRLADHVESTERPNT